MRCAANLVRGRRLSPPALTRSPQVKAKLPDTSECILVGCAAGVRSELAIADAINAACGNGAPEGSAQQLSCDALVAEHGEELADRIFEEGIDGVREQLCVRLAAVCAEEHQEL